MPWQAPADPLSRASLLRHEQPGPSLSRSGSSFGERRRSSSAGATRRPSRPVPVTPLQLSSRGRASASGTPAVRSGGSRFSTAVLDGCADERVSLGGVSVSQRLLSSQRQPSQRLPPRLTESGSSARRTDRRSMATFEISDERSSLNLGGRPSSFRAEFGVFSNAYRDTHKVNMPELARLALFLLFEFAGYAWMLLFCSLFCVPDDARKHNFFQVLEDLQTIAGYGFILVYLNGLHTAERFNYVFNFTHGPWRDRRGVILVLSCLLFAPVMAIVSEKIAAFSITANISVYGMIVLGVGGLLALPVIFWHCSKAWRLAGSRKRGILVFLAPRLAIVVFYIVFLAAAHIYKDDGGGDFHLHHYVFGWWISLLAAFNHPVSTAVLVLGMSFHWEGLAAYHADPLYGPAWHNALLCPNEG